MESQQGPSVQRRQLCSVLRGSLDARGLWGRMDPCTCTVESLCFPPETITTVLVGCAPEGEMHGESNMETYITICKIDSPQEFAIWLRKLKQELCINLEGWDGEGDGREVQRRGIYVYLWLIHVEF